MSGTGRISWGMKKDPWCITPQSSDVRRKRHFTSENSTTVGNKGPLLANLQSITLYQYNYTIFSYTTVLSYITHNWLATLRSVLIIISVWNVPHCKSTEKKHLPATIVMLISVSFIMSCPQENRLICKTLQLCKITRSLTSFCTHQLAFSDYSVKEIDL